MTRKVKSFCYCIIFHQIPNYYCISVFRLMTFIIPRRYFSFSLSSDLISLLSHFLGIATSTMCILFTFSFSCTSYSSFYSILCRIITQLWLSCVFSLQSFRYCFVLGWLQHGLLLLWGNRDSRVNIICVFFLFIDIEGYRACSPCCF